MVQKEREKQKNKEILERKKIVKQEEEKIAHELAQKYRSENNNINQLEEYNNF